MSAINQLDLSILIYIQDHIKNDILDPLMIMFTTIGDFGILWILTGTILIFTKKYRKEGFLTLAVLLVGAIIGDLALKHLFQRERPFVVLPSIPLLISAPQSYSFPSGHTLSSFAAAFVLIDRFYKYKILILFTAFCISFSRLYLFVHYPTDILVGAILGYLCAATVLSLSRQDF